MAMRALTLSWSGILKWMKQYHYRFLPLCFIVSVMDEVNRKNRFPLGGELVAELLTIEPR